MVKINNFRGDLTDISAKKEALEISLRSPRKMFMFSIKKCIYTIKVSKKHNKKNSKKLHCVPVIR